MPKREIKKTQICYGEQNKKDSPSPERSREKMQPKVEVVDQNSRKARLAALKKREQAVQKVEEPDMVERIEVKIDKPLLQSRKEDDDEQPLRATEVRKELVPENKVLQEMENEGEESDIEDEERRKVLMKPIFISKEDREEEENVESGVKEEERKKKALRYTTKMLLIDNNKAGAQEDEEVVNSSDQEIRTDIPDDDDQKNEQFEYEQWKIRELKRIRRDREERRKAQREKAEIERRRKMNNEQILLENKVMGSDATDNATETKYVFMQKYYHKGAFYQDSEDPIFKRDYNLPTPLEMQDKSMLPQILQKRKGNFGARGQSKYKHLSAEDTTNFDPTFKPDESILSHWKKKTAGYKGSGNSNSNI